MVGGLRHLSGGDQQLLAIAGDHIGRIEEYPDRGVSASRRGLRREGWNLRELGALAAMEVGGRADARRGQAGSGNTGQDFPESPGTLSEGRRQIPGPDRQFELELHGSWESVAGRSCKGVE